jgi:hypothetical protein
MTYPVYEAHLSNGEVVRLSVDVTVDVKKKAIDFDRAREIVEAIWFTDIGGAPVKWKEVAENIGSEKNPHIVRYWKGAWPRRYPGVKIVKGFIEHENCGRIADPNLKETKNARANKS